MVRTEEAAANHAACAAPRLESEHDRHRELRLAILGADSHTRGVQRPQCPRRERSAAIDGVTQRDERGGRAGVCGYALSERLEDPGHGLEDTRPELTDSLSMDRQAGKRPNQLGCFQFLYLSDTGVSLQHVRLQHGWKTSENIGGHRESVRSA